MLPKVGRNLYAAALLAFAIQQVLCAVTGGGIGPPWIVGHTAWAWIMGAVLLVTSFSIATGKQAGVIAAGFTVVLLSYVEIIYWQRLAANIRNPGPWTSSAELICVAGASFVIAGMHLTGKFSVRAKLVGRMLFALPPYRVRGATLSLRWVHRHSHSGMDSSASVLGVLCWRSVPGGRRLSSQLASRAGWGRHF